MMVFWRLLRIVTHPVALAGVAAVLIALGGGHYVRIRADLATAQEALQESRDNHVRAMAALAQRERELSRLRATETRSRAIIEQGRGTHADGPVTDLQRRYLDGLR